MQLQSLPAHICLEIDKINRNFLWGSSNEQRKPHYLRWEIVNLPKEKGGLNIRTAKDNNLAMLSKLGWRLLNNDKAAWCLALRHKYLKNESLWTAKSN